MVLQEPRVRQLKVIALTGLLVLSGFAAAQAREPVWEARDGEGYQRVLIVGCDSDYYPMSFLVDGQAAGFDVEMIRELGRLLNFKPIIVMDTWSTILSKLRSGEIDVVTGILQTDERSKVFQNSIPYWSDSYALFSRLDTGLLGLRQLAGYRLALLEDDAALELHLKSAGLGDDIIEYPDTISAFRAVAGGDADYTIAPTSYGFALMDSAEFRGTLQKSRALFSVDFRLAFQIGRTDLLAEFNDALAELLRNGFLEQTKQRWRFYRPFSVSASSSLSPFNIVLVVIVLGIGFFAFLVQLLVKIGLAKANEAVVRLEAVIAALPVQVYWQAMTDDQTRGSEKESALQISFSENKVHNKAQQEAVVVYEQNPQAVWHRIGKVELPEQQLRVIWRQDWDWEYQAQSKIQRLSAELAEVMCSLEESRVTDPVSGLFSRAYFGQIIRQAELQRIRSGEAYGLVILVDTPRDILETRVLAKIIRSVFSPSDMAFRFDTEQYLILVQRGFDETDEALNQRIGDLAGNLQQAMYRQLWKDMACIDSAKVQGSRKTTATLEKRREVDFIYKGAQETNNPVNFHRDWLQTILDNISEEPREA